MTTSSSTANAEDRNEHGHDQRNAEEPESIADRGHAVARARAGTLEQGDREARLEQEAGPVHAAPPFHARHGSKKSQ